MDWQWNEQEVLVASPIEYLGTSAVDILDASVTLRGSSGDLALRVALFPIDSPGDIAMFRPSARRERFRLRAHVAEQDATQGRARAHVSASA